VFAREKKYRRGKSVCLPGEKIPQGQTCVFAGGKNTAGANLCVCPGEKITQGQTCVFAGEK